MPRCSSCGEENPDRARFCMACSAPLAVIAPEGIRKTVTILFCDLVGSTAMGEGLDPEALREVLTLYFTTMQECIERHGGSVEKYIGDAIMAAFGLPRVHEDDALRAMRAALDMRRALAEVNAHINQRYGTTLSVRTGVFTGEVVAGDPSTGQRLATGDAVNTAARLEQAAPNGEALIGETTWRLVRDVVVAEPVEAVVAKGKVEPIRAWRLVDVRPGMPSPARRMDTPLVGRDTEMATLVDAFDSARSDRSGVMVTLFGEPGVGKSRLAAACVSALADRATVLVGRCPSYGEGASLLPLEEVVEQAAAMSEDDGAEERRSKLVGLVAREADGERLATRLAAAFGWGDGSFALEETFWAARRLFESLALRRPVVLLFEDLHWAEPAFLDLLEQLSQLAVAPILILATARNDLLELRPGWDNGPGRMALRLDTLSPEDSAQLAREILASFDLPDEVFEGVNAAARGNPLFLEQILAVWMADGRLQQLNGRWTMSASEDDLVVPPTISALLEARLDALTRAERGIIERGAIVGQMFEQAAVITLSLEDEEPSVPAALDSLVRKQLIVPMEAEPGRDRAFGFAHVLIRDAAYRGMLKRTRARLHERFADWLEARMATRAAGLEEVMGFHLEQAYRQLVDLGPVDERGLRLAVRAGEHLASAGQRAAARGDVSAVIKLLERAMALLPEDHSRRLPILLELGAALRQARQRDRAREVQSEALGRASATEDPRLIWRAKYELFETFLGEDPWTHEQAEREVSEVIPVLTELRDDLGLSKAWQLLALVQWEAGKAGPAEQAQRRALEFARRAGDLKGVVEIAAGLPAIAEEGPAPFSEAVALAQQVLPDVADHLQSNSFVLGCLASLLAKQGRFDEARAAFAESLRALREGGGGRWIVQMHWLAGLIEYLAGDLDAADRECRQGLDQAAAQNGNYSLWLVAPLFIEVASARGRIDEAAPYLGSALAAPPEVAPLRSMGLLAVARVAAARGDMAEAERLAQEAIAVLEPTDDLNNQGLARLRLAEILDQAGRTEEALDAAGAALDLFEHKGSTVLEGKARALSERLTNMISTKSRSW